MEGNPPNWTDPSGECILEALACIGAIAVPVDGPLFDTVACTSYVACAALIVGIAAEEILDDVQDVPFPHINNIPLDRTIETCPVTPITPAPERIKTPSKEGFPSNPPTQMPHSTQTPAPTRTPTYTPAKTPNNTCNEVYPGVVKCSDSRLANYRFGTHLDAWISLENLKGQKNTVCYSHYGREANGFRKGEIRSPVGDPARDGPCRDNPPERTGRHWNVFSKDDWKIGRNVDGIQPMGAIGQCSCCSDEAGRPEIKCVCRK